MSKGSLEAKEYNKVLEILKAKGWNSYNDHLKSGDVTHVKALKDAGMKAVGR